LGAAKSGRAAPGVRMEDGALLGCQNPPRPPAVVTDETAA
jgi:hypothetical protein